MTTAGQSVSLERARLSPTAGQHPADRGPEWVVEKGIVLPAAGQSLGDREPTSVIEKDAVLPTAGHWLAVVRVYPSRPVIMGSGRQAGLAVVAW